MRKSKPDKPFLAPCEGCQQPFRPSALYTCFSDRKGGGARSLCHGCMAAEVLKSTTTEEQK